CGDVRRNSTLTKKHADALLLNNRDAPRPQPGTRSTPPQLEAGMPVFVPPVDVLENRYGHVIPGHAGGSPKTVPSAPAPPGGRVERVVAPPLPTAVQQSGSPTIGAATAWSSDPKKGKTYQVRNPGEPLFEIARRTLGNGSRWTEIYRLNPNLRPEVPIPGGTVLRMPDDARVEP